MLFAAGHGGGKLAAALPDSREEAEYSVEVAGDLRRPGVSARLGISPKTGLSMALQNGLKWRQELVRLPSVPDLDVLPAGRSSLDAADLIGARLPEILEQAARDYDWIVVDAPPVLGLAETLQMAAAVDGVVIVVKAGKTGRRAVAAALQTLRHVQANILGLVLNEVADGLSESGGYWGVYSGSDNSDGHPSHPARGAGQTQ